MTLASVMSGAPKIVLGAPKGPKANATATYTRGGALPTLPVQRRASTYAPGASGAGGGGGGKKGLPATTALNPYDAFNVPQPYDPAGIHQTAQGAYGADVANAQRLSTMGYLTPEQIDAQSKNRADQQTALGSSLVAALSGIQRAYVGSGNAGAAGLAAQDAQQTATGDRSQALAGSTPASTAAADQGTRAVLADQTAAGGNLYGGLQAAALSSASQAASKAYATGDTTKQTQYAEQQKSLAQLLSGVTPAATREASMIDANSKVDTANTGTHLAIWQNLQNQELQARMSGDRKQIAQAQLDSRNYVASLSDKTRAALGITAANAKVTTAKIGAQARTDAATITADARKQSALIAAAAKRATSGGTKPPTTSQRLSVNKAVDALMSKQGGVKTPGGQLTTGYLVTLEPGPNALPNARQNIVPVDSATGAALKAGQTYGPTGQKIIGVAPKTKTGPSSYKNVPSPWTTWKRGLGLVMQSFPTMSRTEATQYMAALGHPAPPSK